MRQSTFSANFELVGQDALVRVRGELDLMTAPTLGTALSDCLEGGSARIAVDMYDVTFMDGAGVNALMAGRREAAVPGATIWLVRPSRCVRHVLRVTNTMALLVV
jgi:anti-sigma B factor antagonist